MGERVDGKQGSEYNKHCSGALAVITKTSTVTAKKNTSSKVRYWIIIKILMEAQVPSLMILIRCFATFFR